MTRPGLTNSLDINTLENTLQNIPHGISRDTFRSLVDPLLAALGTNANDCKSLVADAKGFELVVFDRDDAGNKLAAERGIAEQTIRVHMLREAE